MNYLLIDDTIPGTKLKKAELDGLTGKAFLNRIFMVSDGVMLSQIRKIAGIDGSTLQNWTKRGWVANSRSKRYNMDQVAHILIINMLRSCMQLDHIDFLIHYINGRVDDTSDDIISDSMLYDYICRILSNMMDSEQVSLSNVRGLVEDVTNDYKEPMEGARERLIRALEVIVVTYTATLLKRHADDLFGELEQ
jgi:hypothetical protein